MHKMVIISKLLFQQVHEKTESENKLFQMNPNILRYTFYKHSYSICMLPSLS